MQDEYIDIATHLATALLVGSLIGIERTFSGRPAGFRTHALVCVASTLLMLVGTYQKLWLPPDTQLETIRTDPTRMAQGIMTGIGFLGAGVIFKEGLTVRGLTTAASIWMTAALGTLLGIGFYVPAAIGTGMTLFTLSLFRVIEGKMPTRQVARNIVRFARGRVIAEAEMRSILQRNHFGVMKINYQLTHGGQMVEYHMLISTIDRRNLERLSTELLSRAEVVEFDLTTVAD